MRLRSAETFGVRLCAFGPLLSSSRLVWLTLLSHRLLWHRRRLQDPLLGFDQASAVLRRVRGLWNAPHAAVVVSWLFEQERGHHASPSRARRYFPHPSSQERAWHPRLLIRFAQSLCPTSHHPKRSPRVLHAQLRWCLLFPRRDDQPLRLLEDSVLRGLDPLATLPRRRKSRRSRRSSRRPRSWHLRHPLAAHWMHPPLCTSIAQHERYDFSLIAEDVTIQRHVLRLLVGHNFWICSTHIRAS